MRPVRPALVPPLTRLQPGRRRVVWTVVESVLALVVVGALLGLGVGLALTRTVDLLLSSG